MSDNLFWTCFWICMTIMFTLFISAASYKSYLNVKINQEKFDRCINNGGNYINDNCILSNNQIAK